MSAMRRVCIAAAWLTAGLVGLSPVGRAQGWRSFFSGGRGSGAKELSGSVYIRLVRAGAESEAGKKPDPALADVLPTLKETLRFTSYRLVADRRIRVKEGTVVDLASLELRFSEVAGNTFRLEVRQNRRPILRSRVRLRTARPVVVGGLPSDGNGGALLLIFVREESRGR